MDTVKTGCTSGTQFEGCTLRQQSSVSRFYETIKSGLSAGNAACLYGSDSTSRGLSAGGANFFYKVLNLPPWNCLPGVKPVYMVSKPVPPETVCQGYSQFIWFLNLPTGNCLLRCSLFIRFPNLPAGDCRS